MTHERFIRWTFAAVGAVLLLLSLPLLIDGRWALGAADLSVGAFLLYASRVSREGPPSWFQNDGKHKAE
jgi:hypothetical protein